MPFNVKDIVAIMPIRDTGEVVIDHGVDEYDIARHGALIIGRFPGNDLRLLPSGEKFKIHDRKSISNGDGILYISEYKNRKGNVKVKTIAYLLSSGHNMGRVPPR